MGRDDRRSARQRQGTPASAAGRERCKLAAMGLVRYAWRERWPALAAGGALLGLMAVHVAVRPEHAWVLLASCDVAALATAAGLLLEWERCLGAALVFQISVGMPALAIGLCTTYPANVTGIAIHVVPAVFGAVALAGRTLPRRAARLAWIGYVATVLVTYLAAPPPQFNINFTAAVWAPLARVFPGRAAFFVGLFAVVAVMLWLGGRGLARVFRGLAR